LDLPGARRQSEAGDQNHHNTHHRRLLSGSPD
jgi:hypothetical protein